VKRCGARRSAVLGLAVAAMVSACVEAPGAMDAGGGEGPDGGAPTSDAGTGTGWRYVGPAGFSEGIASSPAIALHQGTPYVAFADHPASNKLTIMRLSGEAWTVVGTRGFTPAAVMDVAAVSCQGRLFVAYRLLQVPAPFDTGFVIELDGDGWKPVGGELGGAGSTAYRIALACGPSGPVAAWSAYEAGALSVAQLEGDAWTLLGGNHGLWANAGVGLALDSTGAPHVGFASSNDQNRPAVRRFTSTAAVAVAEPFASASPAAWASLAFAGPEPVLAYLDEHGLQVRLAAGGSWTTLATNLLTAEGTAADRPSLASTADGGVLLVARSSTPAFSHGAAVQQLVGGALVPVGARVFSPFTVDMPSLAVQGSIPWVAFQDWQHDKRLSVMTPE